MLTEIYKTAENAVKISFNTIQELPAGVDLHKMSSESINKTDDSGIAQVYWAHRYHDMNWINHAAPAGLIIDRELFQTLLNDAIRDYDLTTVKSLMNCGQPTNHNLWLAIDSGNTDVCLFLIGQIPRLDNSTIESVINRDMIEVMDALIGSNPSKSKLSIEQMLELAINQNSVQIISFLISKGVVPTSKMLASAIERGNIDAANILINNGVKPTINMLRSAIYTASDKVKAIEFLTKNGIVPTPQLLEQALRDKCDITIINALIENGCQITDEMLYIAVEMSNIELMNTFMSKGVRPTSGMLQLAVARDNIEAMKILIDKGIQPTEKMLIFTIENGKTEAIQVLLNNGIQPREYLLQVAVHSSNINAMTILMDRGVKPTEEMLETAINRVDLAVSSILIDRGVILKSEIVNRRIDLNRAFNLLGDAISHGRVDVIATLIDLDIKPNQRMLEYAVEDNQIEAIVLLKNRNLIPELATLIKYAKAHGTNDIISILNDSKTMEHSALSGETMTEAEHSIDTDTASTFYFDKTDLTKAEIFEGPENKSGSESRLLSGSTDYRSTSLENDVNESFDKISPETRDETSPQARNTSILMKKKLHDLLRCTNEPSHAKNQDLSEEDAVKQFFENHKNLLMNESKFGQSLFKKTEIQENWNLKEILEHATNSDNRSRKVCVALGWLDKEGQIPETAPQVIKDQFRQDLSLD